MTGKSGDQFAGLESMEPGSARRNKFLNEPLFREQRQVLKKRLKLWREQLDGSAKPEKLVAAAMKRSEKLSTLRKKNLKTALDASRDLEKSWRTLAAFFTNAEKTKGAKVENIDFLNVSLEQLKDKANPLFLKKIAEELKANYDWLDLRDNYSLLIIPGFLGSVQNIDRVAEVAARNKVMLITDFEDVESVEEAVEMIEFHNLTSADEHKAYVCLLCNYLVGRPGYEDLDEPVLYLSPSTAVGGGIYANPTQITTAGVTHGRLKEVDGAKFKIRKGELGEIGNRGVIPITFDFGKVFPMDDTTLFNGDNPGYRKYAVVRTFDCQYSAHRDTDHTGKPAGAVRAGLIHLTKESSEDHTFWNWCANNSERKSGEIIFTKVDAEQKLKTVKFENAFVTEYQESCAEGMNVQEVMTISAQKIKVDAGIDNNWPA